ncbi:killer cell lectin-like receptor subfamily G member 1 [Ranitomeya imitator]|uniref:killer cell lectin-like receptor subfamily G member 1 n=1 Tax=Ranitomeya imitator TaxID=111125 RepID=UPI0037E9433C
MAENITYAEMNLTTGIGKGQKTNTVHLQDENLGVTYAAVKRLPKIKKEKSPKSQKGSGVRGDTVTYAALLGMNREGSKKGEEREKDQLEDKRTKDTYLELNTNAEHSIWKQRVFQGRRFSVILVPSLAAMCLVLLISTITGFVFCAGANTRPGNGSAMSSASDSFSSCPDPWILISNKCYLFSENLKNQRDSEDDCERQKAKLAMVKNGTILKLVKTTKQEFWIGLMSRGTEHNGAWTGKWDDESIETVTEGQGSCAKISADRLVKENCLKELHWICEKKPPQ